MQEKGRRNLTTYQFCRRCVDTLNLGVIQGFRPCEERLWHDPGCDGIGERHRG